MRGQVGAQGARLHRPPLEAEAGVVRQVGLVNHHHGAAVAEFHGEGRLDLLEEAHRPRGVEHLGAVHPGPVGRNPPGPRVVGERKLGELLGDLEGAEAWSLVQLVAEPDAVVEGPDAQGKAPGRGGGFFHPHRHEWDAETLREGPYDVEKTKRKFEESNALLDAAMGCVRAA